MILFKKIPNAQIETENQEGERLLPGPPYLKNESGTLDLWLKTFFFLKPQEACPQRKSYRPAGTKEVPAAALLGSQGEERVLESCPPRWGFTKQSLRMIYYHLLRQLVRKEPVMATCLCPQEESKAKHSHRGVS